MEAKITLYKVQKNYRNFKSNKFNEMKIYLVIFIFFITVSLNSQVIIKLNTGEEMKVASVKLTGQVIEYLDLDSTKSIANKISKDKVSTICFNASNETFKLKAKAGEANTLQQLLKFDFDSQYFEIIKKEQEQLYDNYKQMMLNFNNLIENLQLQNVAYKNNLKKQANVINTQKKIEPQIKSNYSNFPTSTTLNDPNHNINKQRPTETQIKPNNTTTTSILPKLNDSIVKIKKPISTVAEVKTTNSNDTSFIDKRNNKIYKTIKIGDKIWLAENFAYEVNGGCWAYRENENYVATYGYLYDWETAKSVCPSGWHLPTDEEWTSLIERYNGKDNINNIFSALSGRRNSKGLFDGNGDSGYWWSSKENGMNKIWIFYMDNNSKSITKFPDDKKFGFSVRYVKD